MTLLPSLAKQRAEGKLGYVRDQKMYFMAEDWLYTGEVNADGLRHGYGIAEMINRSGDKKGPKLRSTWVDGEMEGLSVVDEIRF